MCNLYRLTPKGDVERYIGSLGRDLFLDDYDATKPVGPRGQGLFIRPDGSALRGQVGQWGLIRHGSPPPKPGERPYNTNNARVESIATKPTFSYAWKRGQRCLIPADWYAEPNWETRKNIWWNLRRADGLPWFLAGLWNEWLNADTGEIVPNYTMVTCNCTGHALLGRLHKDEVDEDGKPLPPEKQDKRSLIHIDPCDWDQWLHGSHDEAMALIKPQPREVFDQTDAMRTDQLLASQRESGSLF